MLVDCINIEKLIHEAKLRCETLIGTSFNSKETLSSLVRSKISDMKNQKYALKLIGNFDPVWQCVDYIIKNPKDAIQNASRSYECGLENVF